jgi:hypothetical protein
MGNWNISIDGTGSHHNHSPSDVNVVLGEIVKLLATSGQHVERVCLTYGARQLYFGDDDGWHPPTP